MVLNSPKGFWRSLPEISLLFYSFTKLKHPKSSTFGIDALSLCIRMAQCHPSSQAFSHLMCYFHHKKDSDASRSKHQAHTLDGIVIGWLSTSNTILFTNPRNQWYYEPDSYRLDSYRLPSSVYPSIVYNSGLFVSLHRDGSAFLSEPYPPGTSVAKTNPDTDIFFPEWLWTPPSTQQFHHSI